MPKSEVADDVRAKAGVTRHLRRRDNTDSAVRPEITEKDQKRNDNIPATSDVVVTSRPDTGGILASPVDVTQKGATTEGLQDLETDAISPEVCCIDAIGEPSIETNLQSKAIDISLESSVLTTRLSVTGEKWQEYSPDMPLDPSGEENSNHSRMENPAILPGETQAAGEVLLAEPALSKRIGNEEITNLPLAFAMNFKQSAKEPEIELLNLRGHVNWTGQTDIERAASTSDKQEDEDNTLVLRAEEAPELTLFQTPWNSLVDSSKPRNKKEVGVQDGVIKPLADSEERDSLSFAFGTEVRSETKMSKLTVPISRIEKTVAGNEIEPPAKRPVSQLILKLGGDKPDSVAVRLNSQGSSLRLEVLGGDQPLRDSLQHSLPSLEKALERHALDGGWRAIPDPTPQTPALQSRTWDGKENNPDHSQNYRQNQQEDTSRRRNQNQKFSLTDDERTEQ